MAIATSLIVAGVAAAGSIAGGAMAASSQKKAAKQAATTAQNTANQNNAMTAQIYGENKAALEPFQQRGNQAGDAINAFLGLPGQPMQQQMNQQRFGTQGSPYGYMGGSGYGDGVMQRQYEDFGNIGGDMNQFSAMQYGQPQWEQNASFVQPQSAPQTAPNYNDAFKNYQNSTGYQFRTNEGVRALDAAASAGGVRNSGAAQKSLAKYGQNIASSEFSNYLAQLANQQGVGLAGASAQAGVAQNYANNVQANNNSAGTAAANAQLYRGQANANMWGQIGGAIGGFASSF